MDDEGVVGTSRREAYIAEIADTYWRFYVEKDYTAVAEEDRKTQLHAVLKIYEGFHLLEVLPQKWGKYCLYKCNCVYYFKNASCWHCILLSMVMDPTIKCPGKWVHQTHQQRRKRGRPGASKGDGDETAE